MTRTTYYHRKGHPKANELGFVSAEDLGDWDIQQKLKAKEALAPKPEDKPEEAKP